MLERSAASAGLHSTPSNAGGTLPDDRGVEAATRAAEEGARKHPPSTTAL
jgi:hypothetical protein